MDINEPMINEEIRDREVRVISADGTQLGVMATRAAIELAEQQGLDLNTFGSLLAQQIIFECCHLYLLQVF